MEKRIKYLKRDAIDMNLWNICISKSTNGVVYAFSFYLDAMASNWDALVLDDYRAVMPLPWRKKWGIYYLYQPFLTAQLGIFGSELSEKTEKDFLIAIPEKFRLQELPLNRGNRITSASHIYMRKNYILSLSTSYENLYSRYRSQIKRNIKKARLKPLIVKQDIPIGEVLALAQQSAPMKKRDVKYLHGFAGIYHLMKEKAQANTYGVYGDGNLLASAAFLFSHNRAYYILVGNHPTGRSVGASHFLIDAFIKNHAGSALILDFEGSDIESLAFFYSGFGAVLEIYPALQFNGLPFYLKWLKK